MSAKPCQICAQAFLHDQVAALPEGRRNRSSTDMATSTTGHLTTRRYGFGAVIVLAILATVSIVSASSADAAVTTHGSFLEGSTALDGLDETNTAFVNAVQDLSADHEMSETETTIRLVTDDPDRKVYGMADDRTACLVEVTTFAGISATCATADHIAEHGLFLARFVPNPADPTNVITADIIVTAPDTATAVTGVPGTNSLVDIPSGEIISIRYDASQLDRVNDLAWKLTDGESVPVGITLP